MVDARKLQESLDRTEIADLISRSILTRDSGWWSEQAACFHSQAKFTSSWWHGDIADFIKAASEQLEETFREGGEQKHMSGNLDIEINGKRATAECDLILYNRRVINGVAIDFATWSRRLHLVCREDGEWKIFRWFAIYERDRMDPVDPTMDPRTYYDHEALARYPEPLRHHLWRNEVKGSAAVKELCIKGSMQERKIREDARNWFDGRAWAS